MNASISNMCFAKDFSPIWPNFGPIWPNFFQNFKKSYVKIFFHSIKVIMSPPSRRRGFELMHEYWICVFLKNLAQFDIFSSSKFQKILYVNVKILFHSIKVIMSPPCRRGGFEWMNARRRSEEQKPLYNSLFHSVTSF